MESSKKKVIIYGVLNWGLGHATRAEPLIRTLLEMDFKVVIASDGQALEYLQKVFPAQEFYKLPEYGIRYGKGSSQIFTILRQLPKIYRAQKAEHHVLKNLYKKYKPAGIISDNRLGFYHRSAPSVYISHQLRLVMPVFSEWISGFHHRFINRYSECWVPDWEGENNISGDLAHTVKPKIPLRFIGPLSRFSAKAEDVPKKYRIAAILSGPEPQRSVLEQKLFLEFQKMEGHFCIIRGTKSQALPGDYPNIDVIAMADAHTIAQVIGASQIIISRSGYSSLMDYYYLGNSALLIPTPGQPEQEYLARYQLHKGRFAYVSQEYMSLSEDLKKARLYPGFANEKAEKPHLKDLLSLFKGK